MLSPVWIPRGSKFSIEATVNGFVFDNYDSNGLFWAMDQAMDFFHAGAGIREREISRIMTESRRRFNHEACAKEYIKLYEQMLDRPLVKKDAVEPVE